jgi:hypothetical protein
MMHVIFGSRTKFIVVLFLFFSCQNKDSPQSLLQTLISQRAYTEFTFVECFRSEAQQRLLVYQDTLEADYDAEGRLLREGFWYFEYNTQGNLAARHLWSASAASPLQSYFYRYDTRQQLVQIDRRPHPDSLPSLAEKWLYDAQGKLAKKMYFEKKQMPYYTEAYGYQQARLQEKQMQWEQPSPQLLEIRYLYDEKGLLEKEIQVFQQDSLSTNQKEYLYDEQGRVTLIKVSKMMPLYGTLDSYLLSVLSYEYDPQGRKKEVLSYLIDGQGRQVPYTTTQYRYWRE